MKLQYNRKVIAIHLCMFLIILLFSCSRKKDNTLIIKGSDTLVHLTSSWAQAFMKKNKANIQITGGGSGTGIVALLNGTADIAMASRSIKSKELSVISKKGFSIKELIIAVDGVTVIVNRNNPISNLTLEQIEKIYTGFYTNWKELGGADLPIVILSRESSSGTYSFFQKNAMSKKNYHNTVRRFPSNSLILNTVSTNESAIGYVGLGYYLKSKNKVTAVSINGMIPTIETVKSFVYPLTRNLFFYFFKSNESKVNQSFISYVLSPEGQTQVKNAGFVPIARY